MKPFEKMREYDYETAAVGRSDDGKSAARASFERWQQAVALQRAKPPRPVGPIREVEEEKSRVRRERAAALRAEVDALIARAERQLEAPLTDQGQLVNAMRRGL